MKDESLSNGIYRDLKGSKSNFREYKIYMPYDIELLSILKDAVIITDENFDITYWNPAAEEIYGWKCSEVLGKKALKLLKTKFIGTKRPEKIQELIRKWIH